MSGVELFTIGGGAIEAGTGLASAGIPVTLGDALLVGGTLLSAGSAYAQADTQAAMMEMEAEEKRREGIRAEELEREENERRLASMRAQYGASGVQLEGTPLTVLEESAAAGERNALALRYGGAASAASRYAGAGALRATGIIGAGASLLTGGSKVIDRL